MYTRDFPKFFVGREQEGVLSEEDIQRIYEHSIALQLEPQEVKEKDVTEISFTILDVPFCFNPKEDLKPENKVKFREDFATSIIAVANALVKESDHRVKSPVEQGYVEQAVLLVFTELDMNVLMHKDLIFDYQQYISQIYSQLHASHMFTWQMPESIKEYVEVVQEHVSFVLEEKKINRFTMLSHMLDIFQKMESFEFDVENGSIDIKGFVNEIDKMLEFILKEIGDLKGFVLERLKSMALLVSEGQIDLEYPLSQIVDGKDAIARVETLLAELNEYEETIADLSRSALKTKPEEVSLIRDKMSDEDPSTKYLSKMKDLFKSMNLTVGKVFQVFSDLSQLHFQSSIKMLEGLMYAYRLTSGGIVHSMQAAQVQRAKDAAKKRKKSREKSIKKGIEMVGDTAIGEGAGKIIVGLYDKFEDLRKMKEKGLSADEEISMFHKYLRELLKGSNLGKEEKSKLETASVLSEKLGNVDRATVRSCSELLESLHLTSEKLFYYIDKIYTVADMVIKNLGPYLHWIEEKEPGLLNKIFGIRKKEMAIGIPADFVRKHLRHKLIFALILMLVFDVKSTINLEYFIKELSIEDDEKIAKLFSSLYLKNYSESRVATALSEQIVHRLLQHFPPTMDEDGKPMAPKKALRDLDKQMLNVNQLVHVTPEVRACIQDYAEVNDMLLEGDDISIDEIVENEQNRNMIHFLLQVFEYVDKVRDKRKNLKDSLQNMGMAPLIKILTVYLSSGLSMCFAPLVADTLTPKRVERALKKVWSYIKKAGGYLDKYVFTKPEIELFEGSLMYASATEIFDHMLTIPRFAELVESVPDFKDTFFEEAERFVKNVEQMTSFNIGQAKKKLNAAGPVSGKIRKEHIGIKEGEVLEEELTSRYIREFEQMKAAMAPNLYRFFCNKWIEYKQMQKQKKLA